jgi:hypothetical protein
MSKSKEPKFIKNKASIPLPPKNNSLTQNVDSGFVTDLHKKN